MAKAKATLLTARLSFLEARFSPDDRARVMAALSAGTRTLLESTLAPSSWVPFEAIVELTRVIDDVLGSGDLSLATEAGRFSAEFALAQVRDSLVSSGGPIFLFRQAPSIWHQIYDSGSITGKLASPTHGRFRIEGFAYPASEHCAAVGGWIERTLSLTGVESVAVDHDLCRVRGDGACEYACSWALPPKTRA